MSLFREEQSKTTRFGIRKICSVLVLISLSFAGTNAARAHYSFPRSAAEISKNALLNSQTRAAAFLESCINIAVNGGLLTAECKGKDNRYRKSSIEIRGIRNNNGNLEYTKNPRSPSSFQETCEDVKIKESRLVARCERRDGSYSRTSIMIRGIYNNNGRLEYAGD